MFNNFDAHLLRYVDQILIAGRPVVQQHLEHGLGTPAVRIELDEFARLGVDLPGVLVDQRPVFLAHAEAAICCAKMQIK